MEASARNIASQKFQPVQSQSGAGKFQSYVLPSIAAASLRFLCKPNPSISFLADEGALSSI